MWQSFLENVPIQKINSKISDWEHDTRWIWAISRSLLENNTYKHKRFGGKRKSHWPLFLRLTMVFGLFLKILKLYQRGYKNSRNIIIKEAIIRFDHLSRSFDTDKMLQLTDFHLNCIEILKILSVKRLGI